MFKNEELPTTSPDTIDHDMSVDALKRYNTETLEQLGSDGALLFSLQIVGIKSAEGEPTPILQQIIGPPEVLAQVISMLTKQLITGSPQFAEALLESALTRH